MQHIHRLPPERRSRRVLQIGNLLPCAWPRDASRATVPIVAIRPVKGERPSSDIYEDVAGLVDLTPLDEDGVTEGCTHHLAPGG